MSRFQVSGFKFAVGIQVLALCLMSMTLFSCQQIYVPKPHSYYRIDFPEREYRLYDSICPFTFEYPVYGTITPTRLTPEPCCFNIYFRGYEGTIYLTYNEINNNFDQLIEGNWKIIFSGIAQMADGVAPHEYVNPEQNVFGTIYDIKGNAASSVLFFATDSIKNFLSGSLYFNTKPNQDSLAPVITFFREDIIHLMESIQWKEENGKLKIK